MVQPSTPTPTLSFQTLTPRPALQVFRRVKDKCQNVQLEARFYAPGCPTIDSRMKTSK